jgi:hypothetical protein
MLSNSNHIAIETAAASRPWRCLDTRAGSRFTQGYQALTAFVSGGVLASGKPEGSALYS